MASTDSPAAARRRIRLAVRKAREAKHLTQGEVAENLEWSISKVNRIENGDVTISLTDLRALLALLDITDSDTVDELGRDAKAARKRGWWDDPRYRADLTPGTLQLIQYEADASAIRTFQPTLIPGVLQTPDYASTIMNFWSELSEDARETRRHIRMQRNRRLLGRSDSPQYLVILDESVIQRQVGGPAVMAAQLSSLMEAIKSSAVLVRIVPLADGAPIAYLGDFTIVDLGGEHNSVLYREAALADNITDAQDVVDRYRATFEQMWDISLTPDESTRLIEANFTSMLASADRARRVTS